MKGGMTDAILLENDQDDVFQLADILGKKYID